MPAASSARRKAPKASDLGAASTGSSAGRQLSGTASALVTGGMYRFTRNPMYLGLLLTLMGWAAFLASPPALVFLLLYVVYINRFQIEPEERTLSSLFGADY